MIGRVSAWPNMVMARLSEGEKCWRWATAAINWARACASKSRETGLSTRTLALRVSHISLAVVYGIHADSSSLEK